MLPTPAIALPNRNNRDDVEVWFADGTSSTASEFLKTIGGLQGIRLMVRNPSSGPLVPELSEQRDPQGQMVLSFAFTAGSDQSGRITSAAVILRESDIRALRGERFMARLADLVPDAAALVSTIEAKISLRQELRRGGPTGGGYNPALIGFVLLLIGAFLMVGMWLGMIAVAVQPVDDVRIKLNGH